MHSIKADLNCGTKEFKKYWQKCVGSGHASLGLRTDWLKQLKFIRDELGMEYVRFHGLFNDDMKIVTSLSDMIPLPGAKDVQTLSFYQVGILFDNILSVGMKPFVELGFMPSAYASSQKNIFFYKGNVTPPRDWEKWRDLNVNLMEFLIDRYGRDEIRSWYFEVWNEPDLKVFWKGSRDDYFRLYKITAEALKSVEPEVRVGGPATSGNLWLREFRQFCEREKVPVDFLSTHHYPGVALGHDVSAMRRIREVLKKVRAASGKDIHSFFRSFINQDEQLSRAPRGNLTEQARIARTEAGELPLIYTEWNSNSGCTYHLNDEPYTAAFIVKTVIDNHGLVNGYSFWTFSDLFEELSFFHKPFSGSFGMLNIHGIPKPSFWAFKLLSKLGREKLDIPVEIESETLEIAFFRNDLTTQILIYNQQMPGRPIEEEQIELRLENLTSCSTACIERIDDSHGHPRRIWSDLGEPEYLKPADVEHIKEASFVREETLPWRFEDGTFSCKVTIPPYGVALISIVL